MLRELPSEAQHLTSGVCRRLSILLLWRALRSPNFVISFLSSKARLQPVCLFVRLAASLSLVTCSLELNNLYEKPV